MRPPKLQIQENDKHHPLEEQNQQTFCRLKKKAAVVTIKTTAFSKKIHKNNNLKSQPSLSVLHENQIPASCGSYPFHYRNLLVMSISLVDITET